MSYVLVFVANMVPVILLKMEDSIARVTPDGQALDVKPVSIIHFNLCE